MRRLLTLATSLLIVAPLFGVSKMIFRYKVSENFASTKVFSRQDQIVVGVGSVRSVWTGSLFDEAIAIVEGALGLGFFRGESAHTDWIRLWVLKDGAWSSIHEEEGALYDVLPIGEDLFLRVEPDEYTRWTGSGFEEIERDQFNDAWSTYTSFDEALEESDWETYDLYPYNRGVVEEELKLGDLRLSITVNRLPVRLLGTEWHEHFQLVVTGLDTGPLVLLDKKTKWRSVEEQRYREELRLGKRWRVIRGSTISLPDGAESE